MRGIAFFIAGGATLLAPSAVMTQDHGGLPGPPPPRPPVIASPAWAVPPTPQPRDYPRRAQEAGSAVIRCVARHDGVPVECRILSEAPASRGFGQAALRVVRRARLTQDSVDGAGMDAALTVTVNFPVP